MEAEIQISSENQHLEDQQLDTVALESAKDNQSTSELKQDVQPETTTMDVSISREVQQSDTVENTSAHDFESTSEVHQDAQPETTSTVFSSAEQDRPENSTVASPTMTYKLNADGLPQYLHDAVARIAPQEGFTPGNYRVSFEGGSGKGDGFVAEMFRATITEGDRKKTVLCKIAPINDIRRRQLGSMTIFDREVQAYDKFLPIIYEFQREKGITEEMDVGFFNAPHCYMAYIDESKEETVIIMDDLRLKDYRMWNKLVPVNYEHARLLMVQLGRLHAVSLALKDQRPEVFEQFKVPDPMTEMMKSFEAFVEVLRVSLDRAMTTLGAHEERARQKLLRLRETMLDDLSSITDLNFAEPYAVLGHGDCWVNNFMYAYKRGVPTEVILLDWQICRYVSPALDLLYFMFCCTDESFRKQHYDELIRIYYSSLKDLLKKMGGDAARQFPYTALLRQLKACGKFGIIMAIFVLPVLCIDNQDLPDLDAEAEKFHETKKVEPMFSVSEKSEDRYRKRMRGIIRDMVNYGYL